MADTESPIKSIKPKSATFASTISPREHQLYTLHNIGTHPIPDANYYTGNLKVALEITCDTENTASGLAKRLRADCALNKISRYPPNFPILGKAWKVLSRWGADTPITLDWKLHDVTMLASREDDAPWNSRDVASGVQIDVKQGASTTTGSPGSLIFADLQCDGSRTEYGPGSSGWIQVEGQVVRCLYTCRMVHIPASAPPPAPSSSYASASSLGPVDTTVTEARRILSFYDPVRDA